MPRVGGFTLIPRADTGGAGSAQTEDSVTRESSDSYVARQPSADLQGPSSEPAISGGFHVGRAAAVRATANAPSNIMALRGSVGPGAPNTREDVVRLERRLIQLDVLAPEDATGEFSDYLSAAIVSFQERNAAALAAIRASNDGPLFGDGSRGSEGTRGSVAPGDATHQALANAWPREIHGRLMTEVEAYDYLSGAVRSSVGAFDESATHIVGVRGYQGGAPHENLGVRRRNNRWNDELFVLTMVDGRRRVRSFMGTTDPGGRTGHTSSDDPRTTVLDANQQILYRVGTTASRFRDRPALWMQTGRGVTRGGASHDHAVGVHGRRGDVEITEGIAIHSGGRGPVVTADSTGCQVIHGDWYPAFYGEVRRGVGNASPPLAVYTLLEGAALPTPP